MSLCNRADARGVVNKKLQQIQAFGTDGDGALVEAFTHICQTTLVYFACKKKYSFQTQGPWDSIITF